MTDPEQTGGALAADQALAARQIGYWNWVHPPIAALAAWAAGASVPLAAGLALILCLAAEAALRLRGRDAFAALAVVVMAQPAVIVGALAGHPWQIDGHMYFFALLAVLSAMTCSRALLAGAALVAVHHLGFNFTLPALIYPDGASLSRTVLHAVVVVVETAALVAMIERRLKMRAEMQRAALDAQKSEEEAKAADLRAEQAREGMLATLGQEFEGMVRKGLDGAFDARISARFDDSVIASLADGLNRLYASVDAVLNALEAELSALAQGDLTAEMNEAQKGRFETLRGRMNETVASLRQLIGGVSRAAGEAHDAARRISADARAVSDQAGAQAAAVEETAAALQEISATVRSNAELLSDAELMARGAADKTRSGEDTARRSVQAVERIRESSDKITEIISMIEGIAFQTNLLALNAAVEAARAGEAGRGFAVVASEVRSLAQRTTEAAANVTDLVRQSASAVGDGVRMVEQTGGALGEIAAAVDGLIQTMAQIAEAGRSQAEGVVEIEAGISRINDAIQSNAESAQSAATSADDLSGMVQRLEAMVARFRTGEGRGSIAAE
jgi:methyl-accepting chemotaxis protein